MRLGISFHNSIETLIYVLVCRRIKFPIQLVLLVSLWLNLGLDCSEIDLQVLIGKKLIEFVYGGCVKDNMTKWPVN